MLLGVSICSVRSLVYRPVRAASLLDLARESPIADVSESAHGQHSKEISWTKRHDTEQVGRHVNVSHNTGTRPGNWVSFPERYLYEKRKIRVITIGAGLSGLMVAHKVTLPPDWVFNRKWAEHEQIKHEYKFEGFIDHILCDLREERRRRRYLVPEHISRCCVHVGTQIRCVVFFNQSLYQANSNRLVKVLLRWCGD